MKEALSVLTMLMSLIAFAAIASVSLNGVQISVRDKDSVTREEFQQLMTPLVDKLNAIGARVAFYAKKDEKRK